LRKASRASLTAEGRDQYKPIIVTIRIDRADNTVHWKMALGGACGSCGGRGEDHSGLNGGSVGNGGIAGTGLDIGTAIKDAVIGIMSGGAVTHDPADDCGCHTADTTTGNTGLGGGTGLGIGN